jgi:hypothetical protein
MRFARLDRRVPRSTRFILGLAGLAVTFGPAFASGPWTPRDNTWNGVVRFSALSSSEAYDSEGNKVDLPADAKDWTAAMSAEYGLSDRWSLALGLPLRFLKQEAAPFDDFNNGFGDFFLGVRFGALGGDKAAVSLQLEGVLPSGYNANGQGRPPLGLGKKRLGGRVLAGYSLAPTPAYVQAEVGYHKGNDPVAPELVGGAEVGVWPTPRVLLFADAQWSKNGDDEKRFEDFTRAGINVDYRVKGAFHVSAGAGSELSGKNHLAGTSIRLGVAWKGETALDPYRGRLSRPDARRPEPKIAPVPAPAPAPAPAAADSTKTGD